MLEQAEYEAEQLGITEITLQDRLGNETIGDIVDQYGKDNTNWLNINDFLGGDNGDFATIRDASESSHDIVMGNSMSSDVSQMDL